MITRLKENQKFPINLVMIIMGLIPSVICIMGIIIENEVIILSGSISLFIVVLICMFCLLTFSNSKFLNDKSHSFSSVSRQ